MISNVILEVFNRTDRALIATKDGQEYPIPPGRSHLRADVVPFAKTQNPVPGTDDGATFESLISVVEQDPARQRDPLDLLPQAILALMSKERLDRSTLAPDRQDGHELTFRKFRRAEVSLADPTDGMLDPGLPPA